MSYWRPRKLLSFPVPVSLDGKLKEFEIQVETWRFTAAVELAADVWWQRAPLLESFRTESLRGVSEAWRVRHRGTHFATVIEFRPPISPGPHPVSECCPVPYGGPVVAKARTTPGPLEMAPYERLMLVQDGAAGVCRCSERDLLWQWLVTPLAKPLGEEDIRAEQSLRRMELGMTLEDVEALKNF